MFTLSGKWCRNGLVGGCVDGEGQIKQIGEFGTVPNIEKRVEFLRRGVMILDSLPDKSVITSDGTYSGPLKYPDFTAWKCTLQADGSHSCYADFSNTDFEDENLLLYDIEKYFKKTIGGYVVPENTKALITTNPFTNVSCETSGSKRNCTINNNPQPFVVKFPDSKEADKSIETGYILNQNGATKLEIPHPSKLAFKILGGTGGQCNIRVSVQGSSGYVENRIAYVKADGKWHFLLDENSKERLILGKSRYNTLEPISSSYPFQDLNKPYFVNIEFIGGTWKDERERNIACGEGTLAFFIPQNEILVETSGFVSFKNLLSSNKKPCGSTSSDKKCVGTHNLTFDIINPLYDFRDNIDVKTDLLDSNFYEYKEINNDIIKSKRKSVSIKFDSNSNNGWSDEIIFVRKGQILRFDEENWFDISGSGDNSYDIKSKVLQIGNTTKGVSEGLVMKIDSRPAIICRGSATEKYNNPNCSLARNSDGEKTCNISYEKYCVSEEAKDGDGKSIYCPLGCYPDSVIMMIVQNHKVFFLQMD